MHVGTGDRKDRSCGWTREGRIGKVVGVRLEKGGGGVYGENVKEDLLG